VSHAFGAIGKQEPFCRAKVKEYEETIREKGQEAFMLQKQLADAQRDILRARTASSSATVATGTAQRTNQREHELLAQMDEIEESYQKHVAKLQESLDAVKTENLTMCLEIKDVGKVAQLATRQVSHCIWGCKGYSLSGLLCEYPYTG
jgi:chromosome segregation ATPase